ncbi:MAG: hypothetical protein QMD12_02635 [Candidatus Aenigmarchaeota archaeon]|nr:hypothetical protein [Candidatus Aenigmarchaeota archaeon]
MKDWEKEYATCMHEKIVPQILDKVRKFTGYNGDFNIKFCPKWFIFSGPSALTVYDSITGKIKRHEIRIREPRLYSNSPWDVYFYGWSLAGEALHIVNHFQPELNLSSERKVHITALFLIDRYMRENYPGWYRKNRFILERIKREIIFMS